MIVFCQNSSCENEADYLVENSFSFTPLCGLCRSAFELGQLWPQANVQAIEAYDEDDLKNCLTEDMYEEDGDNNET